ncbi:hypothetical protein [Nocardioides sp.]|uniref:hypothetical protein n=1 Tax=Nocardioides sp. TaxID=35761 RepID=UPI0026352138|nr:hypothetical protein [Nocardioides sp.]
MKSSIAAGIVGLSLVAGVGVAYAVDTVQGTGNGTTTTPTRTPSAQPTPTLAGPITPGAVAPVRAGMSIADAVATGYVERDTGRGAVCVGDFYRWSAPNTAGLDLVTSGGTISAIGIHSSRYRTADGVGVGSRLSEIRAAYPSGRIKVTSDYGQPGILVHEGDKWLGFLFGDATSATLNTSSMVTFAEVSQGARPGLLRDGC